MSDPLMGRPDGPSMAFGASLGMIGTGIVAFIVGALYQCVAFRTGFDTPNQWLVFTPVVVTSICFAALLSRHRRRSAAVVLALFSAAGMVAMLLRSGWGGGIADASPEFTRMYNQYTYASDLLFFFAHVIQLASAMLILTIGRRLPTTAP